jgi:hypothetical protein
LCGYPFFITKEDAMPRDTLATEQSPRDRLNACADLAWAQSSDLEAAIQALLDMLRDDAEAYASLMQMHEATAARHLLGGMMRSNRSAIWNSPIGGSTAEQQAMPKTRESAMASTPAAPFTRPTAPDARVLALASVMMMSFPLPGGKKLGDATGAEVAEAARHYNAKARDMSWKARWLEAIAARAGAEKVGKVLTEADLQKMKLEATNA